VTCWNSSAGSCGRRVMPGDAMSLKLNVATHYVAQLYTTLIGIVLVPCHDDACFPTGCKVPDLKEIACAT
jgi:hypothetical protein